MRTDEFAKETKETLDVLKDIQEIDDVLQKYHAGYAFDENKAREIIAKHNAKDAVVCAYNSTPGKTIPLAQATGSMLYENLQQLRKYLLNKREVELLKALEKEMFHDNQK